MSPLYFRFINSGFFDFVIYALTFGLAFQVFGLRHEIVQVKAPVWTAVTAAVFLILCGAFVVKHIYREKLKAASNENLIETNRYESKIEELYEEIALLNEELLYKSRQTEIISEEMN